VRCQASSVEGLVGRRRGKVDGTSSPREGAGDVTVGRDLRDGCLPLGPAQAQAACSEGATGKRERHQTCEKGEDDFIDRGAVAAKP